MKQTNSFPIKDISIGIYDGPHATPPDSTEGPIFLSIDNVTDEGRLDLSEVKLISERDFPRWTRRVTPKKDDIVFSYEATLHRYAILPDGFCGCLGRRMALVRPNQEKVFPRFLHYYFLSRKWRSIIEANIISGATVDRIPIKKFPYFKVDIPALPVQENIAGLVTPYDDLIDINRRRIQLLEESARLLFREWFVYFRFPGHEKVEIVDGVPEGWKKEKINKLVTFKRGVEPGSNNYLETYESGSFPFFRVSDLVDRNPSIFVDEQYAKSALLKKSDIVVSLDGSVGIVSLGLEGCYSTGIRKLVIKDKKINRAYLYFLMKSHYIQGIINAYAKGTTIQHAGEAIKHMNPILPPQNLMDLFDEIANPALNEILILLDQNQKLAQARDLLLPKLMKGEIRV